MSLRKPPLPHSNCFQSCTCSETCTRACSNEAVSTEQRTKARKKTTSNTVELKIYKLAILSHLLRFNSSNSKRTRWEFRNERHNALCRSMQMHVVAWNRQSSCLGSTVPFAAEASTSPFLSSLRWFVDRPVWISQLWTPRVQRVPSKEALLNTRMPMVHKLGKAHGR